MRNAWRRIFLLCAACMICMCGLCLAKDGGNLVEAFQLGSNIYYVDSSSVKTHQWSGRKYLEIEFFEKYGNWNTYNLAAIDIEKRKGVILVCGAQAVNDISDIENGVMHPYFAIKIDKLISWTEQNRPDIINEIRTFNRSGQSAGKTDVTGAANATGDMTPPQYDITDSGVVKYTMRADTHDSVKAWLSPGGPDYYIVKMSDSLRATKSQWGYKRPGDYIIAYWKYPHQQYVKHTDDTWEFSEEYDPKEEQDKELMVYRTFSYNPSTDMFTFYSGDGGELDGLNIRVVDRNTIYVEDLSAKSLQPKNWKAEWTAVFKYVNYNSLTKPHKEYADSCSIILYMDDGIWFPDHKCEMAGSTCDQNLFSACVDMALAFKAVKGQIGELPEGYEFTEW